MVESTITLQLEYATYIEPEDDIIELAIQECYEFMYRHDFWYDQCIYNWYVQEIGWGPYYQAVEMSIHELEIMGWQFEPLPDCTPELDEWFTYL